jgi:hypothetical protein
VCDADQWEFINGWYVLVIISDLMTIIGSILKMEIKAKVRAPCLKSFIPCIFLDDIGHFEMQTLG